MQFPDCGPVATEADFLVVIQSKLCAHYKMSDSWNIAPTFPFKQYWEIMDKVCQLVKPTAVSVNKCWCRDNRKAVRQLANILSHFRNIFSVTLPQHAPEAVEQCMDVHMKHYFQWVQEIQEFIISIQQKIHDKDWTEAEIKTYAEVLPHMYKLATALHMEELKEDIDCMIREIQELKQVVKDTLIPVHTDGR